MALLLVRAFRAANQHMRLELAVSVNAWDSQAQVFGVVPAQLDVSPVVQGTLAVDSPSLHFCIPFMHSS